MQRSSFSRWIASVRQRPEHERERIILMLAGACTLLVFAVWLINFHLSDTGAAAVTDATPSPITVFMNNAKSLFANMAQQFK